MTRTVSQSIIQESPKTSDSMLEIARGNVHGISNIAKFGHSPQGVQLTPTDIWDRADGTGTTQDVWIAPTQARIHTIASTSSSDTVGGVGARQVLIYGLVDWDTPEVTEVINMDGDGANAQPTANAYVIIHKMKVIHKGATSANVGTITATAVVDATVTAQIVATFGSTQMLIYGLPSCQTGYMVGYGGSMKRSGAASPDTFGTDFCLLINPEPTLELTTFIASHIVGALATGSSHFQHKFLPYLPIPGPAIIKINAVSAVGDSDATADFNLILINNNDEV
jgi:hypothetical protein